MRQRYKWLICRFHDPRILSATGRGAAIEEKSAWVGFWNEKLVETSKQLFNDPEVLIVLLTGRSDDFIPIVSRILNSRDLKFHLVVLKPKKERGVSNSTLTFKYAFIDDVLRLGESIEEVEIYEDRAPHRDAFENYLKGWRRVKETDVTATSIDNENDGIEVQSLKLAEHSEEIGLRAFTVHFVKMPFVYLDEEVEESLIRTMMEEMNEVDMADEKDQYVMEKKVFSLGYAIEEQDFRTLFDTYLALHMENHSMERHEWRVIRQPSVFIYFNASPQILSKVGGLDKQVEFEVTHLGVSEKVFALRLAPVTSFHQVVNGKGEKVSRPDSHTRFWSKNDVPVLVLATRDGGKPVDANYLEKWTDVPDTIEPRRFTTKVAARQEIRLEQVSKKEAKVRAEQAAHVQNLPRKRFSPQHTNQNNGGYRGGRGGESCTSPRGGRGGRPVYGGLPESRDRDIFWSKVNGSSA